MFKIAIIGKMGSGKSTLADKIITYFSEKNIILNKIAFADKVYEIARNLFGMKEKDRKLLQSIGTKMREIDSNVWVNATLNNLKQNVILEDGRYENEISELKKRGFYCIKLNIPKEIQIERLKNKYKENFHKHLKNINHESELYIDKIKDEDMNLVLDYNYDFNNVMENYFK